MYCDLQIRANYTPINSIPKQICTCSKLTIETLEKGVKYVQR